MPHATHDYSEEKLFEAIRRRDHAGVKKQLDGGINANVVDANGKPAIFAVDQADTLSLVTLLTHGADANTKWNGNTLAVQIAKDLSDVTPKLRSQLHRIQVLLAGGADTTHLETPLVAHQMSLCRDGHKSTNNTELTQYEGAIAEVQHVVDLVHAINKKGISARPALADLVPSPKVDADTIHFHGKTESNRKLHALHGDASVRKKVIRISDGGMVGTFTVTTHRKGAVSNIR